METKREEIIRKWFSMWLSKEDGGILELFSPNAVYTESWGPEYLSAAPYQIVPAVRRFKGYKGCGDILQGGKVLQLFPYYFYSGWEYRAFDDHPAHTLPLSDFINSTWIPPPSVSSSRLSSHSSWITAKREGSVP